MSSIPVTDIKGESVGVVEIPDELLVFDKGEQAVHDVIVAYQAGLRAGTASTLSKGQVAGSNKKPWRQKGLGRARAGYRQSPVWRGGGVVFGPHPRSYAKKVPRRVAQLAFRRAFSEKVVEHSVQVIQDFELSEPKTKLLTSFLKRLKIKGMALIVLDKMDRNTVLASRNVPEAEVVLAKDVNTYQLLRFPNVIVSRPALAVLEDRLRHANGRSA